MLFCPGPVEISGRVRHAAVDIAKHHRSSHFEKVLHDIFSGITENFSIPENYATALITGSGTAANEAALATCIRPGEKILAVNNGEFGMRLAVQARRYGEVTELTLPWGITVTEEKLRGYINKYGPFDWLCGTHNETSTGQLLDLDMFSRVASEYSIKLFIDSISSLGGEQLDIGTVSPSVITASVHKCLSALPGLSLVIIQKQLLGRKDRNTIPVYLNVENYIDFYNKSGQMPFTPAITLCQALREALLELKQETVEGRQARYHKNRAVIREGLLDIGWSLWHPEGKESSCITIATCCGGDKTAIAIMRELEQIGYHLYPTKGLLMRNDYIMIANMGNLFPEDCKKLLDVMSRYTCRTAVYLKKIETANASVNTEPSQGSS